MNILTVSCGGKRECWIERQIEYNEILRNNFIRSSFCELNVTLQRWTLGSSSISWYIYYAGLSIHLRAPWTVKLDLQFQRWIKVFLASLDDVTERYFHSCCKQGKLIPSKKRIEEQAFLRWWFLSVGNHAFNLFSCV